MNFYLIPSAFFRKKRKVKFSLVLIFQLIVLHSAIAQNGRPIIHNFSPISYSSNSYISSPQNWCIGQDIDGKMVISNTSGILIYDGTEWQMVPGTENKRMLKFATDSNGEIFTGGIGEIGSIKANKNGIKEYHSLWNKLDESDRKFESIVNVVAYQGDVYFRSAKKIFRYSKGTFKVWRSESGFLKLVSSSAGLFVSEKNNWYQFQNDSLKVIASSKDEHLPDWTGVFKGEGDTLLISTRTEGFYSLVNNSVISIPNKFAQLSVMNGCEISSTKMAFATSEYGIIIVDKKGAIIEVINESMGLSSNRTYFPYFNNGSLWVALFSGISQIEYNGTSTLDKKNGLEAVPMTIGKFQDRLLVGTYEGASWIEKDIFTEQGKLVPIKTNVKEVFGTQLVDDKFVISNLNGILVLKSDGSSYSVKRNVEIGCTALTSAKSQGDVLYVANAKSVLPIKLGRTSAEELSSSIEFPNDIYSMEESSDGYLWLTDDGVSYIKYSSDFQNSEILTLDQSNGLKEEMGFIKVSSVNNKILFGTDIGAYSFNHATKKLVPFEGFGKQFSDGSTGANNLTEMRNGDVWITTDRQTGILRKQKDNSFIYDSLPLSRAQISDVWNIYEDENNIVWICGTEAIVRYDPTKGFDNKAPYKAFIRSIVVNDKDEIFAGNYADKNGVPTSIQPKSYIPILEYEQNSITIKYGAAYYATDVKLEYSIKLDGKDSEWSSWRTSGEMSYNNLPEGRYTFKVRSRNVYGNISEEAAYTFEISPPWYRTTLAYIIFIIGGILLLYLIVKLNSRRLLRENLKLEGIITERTAEVRQQKDRAEQSEAFKQQFLANMSHEIRTPMNAVMGMTNLVLDTPLKPKQKDYMEGIKKSSDNLLHIINDILDLSKIEAGKMELEDIDFSIADSVDQVKKTLQHRATERGLELMVSIKSEVNDIVLGDPVRLNQILINLTGNAIKFTEKGSVLIDVTKEAQGVKFAIVDTGVGIPEDKLKTVFENFSQANASDTRKFGGTGLGLSISRQLVEMMGGAISIESEVGSGTTFSFIVDFKEGSVENLQQRMALERDVDGSILDGLTILVTDDNEFNRIVARDTLISKANVAIIEAEHGQEAIDILLKQDIDIILMDVQMPVMNGFEATRTIRKLEDEKKKSVPIIALTASVLRTDLDKCKQAGMESYIPKPFKTHDLITGIAEVLGIELRSVEAEVSEPVTTSNQSSNQNVTNLDYLTDFCDGDRVKMKKYIDMFIKGAGKLEAQIENALENDDPLSLADQVHGFNTKFIMMGMKDSKSLSVAIENKLRDDGTIADVREEVELLKSNVSTGVTELSNFDVN